MRTLTNVEEEDLDIHRGRPEGTRPTLGGEMKMAVNNNKRRWTFPPSRGLSMVHQQTRRRIGRGGDQSGDMHDRLE